ncbi:MAG TPA: hypothetical protein VGD14_14940 [bacterium]
MKKIIVVAIIGILICAVFHQTLISSIRDNFISKPSPYYQQRLEYFKKLSIEYYGVPDYGAELDLINSAVHLTKLNTAASDLIIPGFEAIQRLKQKQTLTFAEINSTRK